MPDLRSLAVILTSDCNLRCAYCYQARSGSRCINWQKLRSALDLLLESARPNVRLLFIGGEPLLAFPLLRRSVNYVKARKRADLEVEFEISTNGTLLGAREARFLADHDFDLQVSFDGVEPAQRLRGAGTFVVLDRLLEWLRRDYPLYFMRRFSVAVTAVAQCVPSLADSVEYFLAKGVPRILISPALTHQPGWQPAMARGLDDQFARMFALSLRHYRRTGQMPVPMFHRVASSARLPMPGDWLCGVGRGEALTIDVDGEMSGCVLFARSYRRFSVTSLGRVLRTTGLGSIGDPTFPQRLARYSQALETAGVFHNRWMKRSSLGDCVACAYRRECRVCPVCILHQPANADPNRIPDFVCAFNRLAGKYRRRFPTAPDTVALLTGRARVPELVQELIDHAAVVSVPRRQHDRSLHAV
jgi:uncharacterized protein